MSDCKTIEITIRAEVVTDVDEETLTQAIIDATETLPGVLAAWEKQ